MRWRRALFELHYQLRTEGSTPVRSGIAVGMGVFIGCFPLWGVQLVGVALMARWLRLSRVRMYLAAHVNNPLTIAPLTLLELGVGRWWTTGTWPALTMADLGAGGLVHLGRDVAVGWLIVGSLAGIAFGLVAWGIGLRWSRHDFEDTFREAVSRRFTRTGVVDWEFARAKLKLDPLITRLVTARTIPDGGRLIDLGCGRGLALASIAVSQEMARQERWPTTLPQPPRPDALLGIDILRRRVRTARRAITGDGIARAADLRTWRPVPFRTALLIDVLHDLPGNEQVDLLRRLAGAIDRGGRVIIREVDAGSGVRARLARVSEYAAAVLRGEVPPRLRFRTAGEWVELLQTLGMRPEVVPLGRPGEIVLIVRDPSNTERSS